MSYIGNSPAPFFTAVTTDVFSANGTGTNFALSRRISNLADIEVIVDNIQQNPFSGSYSVSGTTLSFSAAPSAGSNNVVVTYRQATIGSSIPTPNTVGNSALQSNLNLTGNTTTQNILPSANVTYDIGSANMRYRDLYLSGNTIQLGAVSLSTNNDTFVVANTTGGLLPSELGNTTITGILTTSNTIVVGNTTVNTIIHSTGITANGANIHSVNAAFVGGNTASDLRSYSDTISGTAYSNAISVASSTYLPLTGGTLTGTTNTNVNTNTGAINRVYNANTGTSAYTELILETGTRRLITGSSHNYSSVEWNGSWIYSDTGPMKIKSLDNAVEIYAQGQTDTNKTARFFNNAIYLDRMVVKQRQPAFVATRSGSTDVGSATKSTFDVNQSSSHPGSSHFSTTNNRFTAPVAGMYYFFTRSWFNLSTSGTIFTFFYVNGSLNAEYRCNFPSTSTEYHSFFPSMIRYLNANDYVEVYIQGSTSTNHHASSGLRYTEFSGFLIG